MLATQINEGVKKWHVAYTFPKAEKKVQIKLEKIGIEAYLPLQQVVRNWSDRRKKLEVPLFPNYIFVNISEKKRYDAFTVKEILRYVSFQGKVATVNDAVVNSLKCILKEKAEVHLESLPKPGSPVKITNGPFMGIEGILVRRSGKTNLIIQIDALQRAVALNISSFHVEPAFDGM
jgi:transcription antitermination factor NusG